MNSQMKSLTTQRILSIAAAPHVCGRFCSRLLEETKQHHGGNTAENLRHTGGSKTGIADGSAGQR